MDKKFEQLKNTVAEMNEDNNFKTDFTSWFLSLSVRQQEEVYKFIVIEYNFTGSRKELWNIEIIRYFSEDDWLTEGKIDSDNEYELMYEEIISLSNPV